MGYYKKNFIFFFSCMKKYDACFSDLEFQVFIDEMNKNIFNGELTQIIEVTYAYKKIWENLYFNTTLFTQFWWEKYHKNIDYTLLHHKIFTKLEYKIQQIDFYWEKIHNVFTQSKQDKIRIKFLQKQFQYAKNTLLMAQNWLDFEIQKASWNIDLNKETIRQKIQTIKKLEKQNFWGSIYLKKNEVAQCYQFLSEKYGNKLWEIQYYLDKIQHVSPENNFVWEKKFKRQQLFPNVFKIHIHRDDYCKIFDYIFEIYGLPQRTKITNVGSIYDGEEFLEIPQKKSYESKTLKSILKLSLHEIMAHSVNLENTKRRLWNFRGAHNLEKEEWLAVLLEKIFEWYRLEDLWIIASLPTLLIWEICSTKDFKKFLSANYAEDKKAFLRFKRNYSIDNKWVQHKDTSYSRGILKTKQYLQENKNFQDLFCGKVSFDEIKFLKKIDLINPQKPLLQPLFIAEFLYFSIKNMSEKWEINDFFEYMNQKYYFADLTYLKKYYKTKIMKKNINKISHILQKYIPELDIQY